MKGWRTMVPQDASKRICRERGGMNTGGNPLSEGMGRCLNDSIRVSGDMSGHGGKHGRLSAMRRCNYCGIRIIMGCASYPPVGVPGEK